MYDGDRVAVVKVLDPDTYETNVPYSESGKGLFLYSEESVNIGDNVNMGEELRVVSIQTCKDAAVAFKSKIEQINGINSRQKQEFYYICKNMQIYSRTV